MKAVPSRRLPACWLVSLAACSLAMLLLYSRSSATHLINYRNQDEYQEGLQIAEKLRKALQEGREQEASDLILNASRLSTGDDATRAAIYNAIGNVLADETYYQLAIYQYEEGLKILSGSKESDFELKKALHELANRGKGIRRAKDALSADLESINIRDPRVVRSNPVGLKELSAALLINDANVYLLQQQYEQAEGLYKSALQTADATSLAALRRSAYSNLAWSAIQQGQTQEAEKLLATALKQDISSSPVSLRKAMLAVAVGLRQQQRYPEAIRKFEEVIPLYPAAKDPKGFSRATAHLAATYLAAGEPARSKAVLEKIVNSTEALDAEVARYVQATYAQANQRLGDLETALKHFEIYLEQIDKISSHLSTEQGVLSFRETQDQYFEDFIRTAWALSEKKKTYGIAREAIERIRARSLFSLAQARSSWDVPQAGYIGAHSLLYNGIARYRHEETNGDVIVESKPRDRKIQSFSPQQTSPAVQVERQFGECQTASLDKNKAIDESSGAKSSPPATFLEYYVLKDQTLAIVKDRDGKVSGASLPIGKSSLTDLVDGYVRTLDVSQRRGVKEIRLKVQTQSKANQGSEEQLAQQLYTQIVQPLRAFLPADTNTPVVVIPHQVLWYLPFAALSPRSGTRLIDELLLTYAASEASWNLVVNRPRAVNYQNARAWIVGNPVTGKADVCGRSLEFASLPGARKEAEQIADLFGKDRAQLFTGAQADRLRFEAWYSDFGVIHLAAHGVACESQPFESSIMLANLDASAVKINNQTGMLNVASDNRFSINVCGLPKGEWETPAYFAGELTASAVITRYRLNADLVTLSACQTGLGATLGEGMIGFTRAFQAAGARTLIVTLWSVSDEATTELMVGFYKEYLKHGNKAVALRESMLATRKHYPEPRMWAAFSLFGAAE